MNDYRRQQIHAKALALLEEAGVKSLPVSPIAIAEHLDIAVHAKPAHVAGASGWLIKSGESFAIAYATHIPSLGFQRFSVAHELVSLLDRQPSRAHLQERRDAPVPCWLRTSRSDRTGSRLLRLMFTDARFVMQEAYLAEQRWPCGSQGPCGPCRSLSTGCGHSIYRVEPHTFRNHHEPQRSGRVLPR